MIEKFSVWAKNITLSVIIVSILEMLLPNNKMKQYIKIVMGLYILFNILSPIIGQDMSFDIDRIIQDNKAQIASSNITTENVDQTSMNQRLIQIGQEEIEEDIKNKLEEKGYIVNRCVVNLEVIEETDIKQIILDLEKRELSKEEIEKDSTNVVNSNSAENQLVDEIQRIKKVQIGNKTKNSKNISENKKLTTEEIRQVKKMLIEEYEVNEKCLKIN